MSSRRVEDAPPDPADVEDMRLRIEAHQRAADAEAASAKAFRSECERAHGEFLRACARLEEERRASQAPSSSSNGSASNAMTSRGRFVRRDSYMDECTRSSTGLPIGSSSASALYCHTPPTSCDISKTRTEWPSCRSCFAAASPAAPAPTTAARFPPPAAPLAPMRMTRHEAPPPARPAGGSVEDTKADAPAAHSGSSGEAATAATSRSAHACGQTLAVRQRFMIAPDASRRAVRIAREVVRTQQAFRPGRHRVSPP